MKMNRIWQVAVVGLGMMAGITSAYADETPDMHEIRITNVAIQGTGCPQNADQSLLLKAVDLLELNASPWQVDLVSGLAGQRKFCQTTFNIEHPSGWTFAVEAVDLKGSVHLNAGGGAYVKATAYLQGDEENSVAALSWRNFRDVTIDESLVLKPVMVASCGAERATNVKIEAKVEGADGRDSVVKIESPVGVRIKWSKCP